MDERAFDVFQKQGAGSVNLTGLLIQIGITAGLTVGCVFFFSVMRPRNQEVYQPNKVYSRSISMKGMQPFFLESKVPEKVPDIPNTFFGWLSVMRSTTDDDLCKNISVDAAVFIKVLRAMLHCVLFLLGGAVVLIILNALAPTISNVPPTNNLITLDKISTNQSLMLPNLLWGHVAVAFCTSAVIFYRLNKLWEDYVMLRQAYFRSPRYYNSIHAKTILVTNLKMSMLKDDYALADAMEAVNVKHFKSATLAMKVSTLESAVEKREKYVLELESIMHKEFKKPLKAYHPDSAAQLALPGSELPPEAVKLCEKIRTLDAGIREMRENGCDAKALHAGFVEFEYPEDSHEVVEQFHGKVKQLTLAPAPKPQDLIWGNLGRDPSSVRHLRRIGSLLTLALCIGWAFPLAFIVPLTQPSYLGMVWPQLGEYLSTHEQVNSFVASVIPPILLSLLLMFLPKIFRTIAMYQGAYTKGMRTKMTMRKLFLFHVVGFFVFFTVLSVAFRLFSGFSIEKLVSKYFNNPDGGKNFVEKLDQYMKLMSSTFADKGTFWVNFMVNGVNFFPTELARAVPLVMSYLRHSFSSTTPRETLLINNPPMFDYDWICAQMLFYFFITMVYAWVQPMVVIIGAIYFAFASMLFKYQLIFIYGKNSDFAGDFFPTLYKRIVSSVLTAQALFCMYLLASQLWYQGIAIGVIFLVSVFAGRNIYTTHLKNSLYFKEKFGPWDPEALRNDANARREGRRERYAHPALAERLILPFVDPRVEHLLEPYFPQLGAAYKQQQPDSAGMRRPSVDSYNTHGGAGPTGTRGYGKAEFAAQMSPGIPSPLGTGNSSGQGTLPPYAHSAEYQSPHDTYRQQQHQHQQQQQQQQQQQHQQYPQQQQQYAQQPQQYAQQQQQYSHMQHRRGDSHSSHRTPLGPSPAHSMDQSHATAWALQQQQQQQQYQQPQAQYPLQQQYQHQPQQSGMRTPGSDYQRYGSPAPRNPQAGGGYGQPQEGAPARPARY